MDETKRDELMVRIDERLAALQRAHDRTEHQHTQDMEALRNEVANDLASLDQKLNRYVELSRYIWVERAVIGVIGLALTILLGAMFAQTIGVGS